MTLNMRDTGGFSQQFFQTYFQKPGQLKDGTQATTRLQDGILSRQDHDSIKERYLEEAQKAGLDTGTAEAEFESFLSDALDGELDNNSVTGMLEAVQLLGSHSQEVNALKFRDVPFKAPTGKIASEIVPRVGLLTPRSPEPMTAGQDHEHTFKPSLDLGSVTKVLASLGQENPLSGIQQRRVVQALAGMSSPDRGLFEKKIGMLTPAQRNDMLTRVEGVKNPDSVAAKAIVSSILLLPPNGSVSGLVNMKPVGNPKLELNNPEQIASKGFLFRSSMMEKPMLLGTAMQDLDIYAFANLVKDSKAFQSKRAVYQLVTITNPPGNPPMTIDVAGSGYANGESDITPHLGLLPVVPTKQPNPQDALSMNRQPNGELHYGNLADKLLAQNVLLGQQNHHIQRTLQPGESLTMYTRIDTNNDPKKPNDPPNLKKKHDANLRAAYKIHVDKDSMQGQHQPLQIDAVMVAYPTNKPDLDAKLATATDPTKPSGTLDLKASVIEAHINQGSPTPRFVATEYIVDKSSTPPKTEPIFLPGTQYDPANISQIKADMNQLKQQAAALDAKIARFPKNIQPKPAELVKLEGERAGIAQELKQYAIGRNSGLTPYSGLQSIFPNIALDGKTVYEFDVAVNTKPFDTLGTGQDQSTPISRTKYGDKQELSNKMPLAYGNYNNTYDVQFPVSNLNSSEPQTLYISMGSPEEIDAEPAQGQERFGKLYDIEGQPKPVVFTGDKSIRYNGTARVTVLDEQGKQVSSQTVDVTHHNYEPPKLLLPVVVPPKRNYTVKVEFTIPTNSTGPQALHVSTTSPH
jgi:hypothetical protein